MSKKNKVTTGNTEITIEQKAGIGFTITVKATTGTRKETPEERRERIAHRRTGAGFHGTSKTTNKAKRRKDKNDLRKEW